MNPFLSKPYAIQLLYESHPSYSVAELPSSTPVFDFGTAQEIFDRIGVTGRGKNQKKFLKDAEGMIVIRLKFLMVAVPPLAFYTLFEKHYELIDKKYQAIASN